MRDLALMSTTLRVIRNEGGGFAGRMPNSPRGYVWFAGSVALNGQAVSDLFDDGWLKGPAGTDHVVIDVRPGFAEVWVHERMRRDGTDIKDATIRRTEGAVAQEGGTP